MTLPTCAAPNGPRKALSSPPDFPNFAPTKQESPSKVWRLAILISLLGAVLVPVLSFVTIFPLVSELPKWDQWKMAPVWGAYFRGDPVWPLLLRPYNYHLFEIPQVLFFGLGRLTAWDVRAEVVCSYAVAFATLLCLLRLLGRIDQRLLVLSSPFSLLVFSISQYENFLTGTGLGQLLEQFAATLFVTLLADSLPLLTPLPLITMIGVVATFSWAAGLVVWPLGLFYLAAYARSRLGWIACWSILCLATWLLEISIAGRHTFPSLSRLFQFVLILLGNPLTRSIPPASRAAQVVGACLLAAFVILGILQRLLSVGRAGRLAAVLLGLFSVGQATLIAGAHASDPQLALASHYVTATYPLVVAVLIQISTLALRVLDMSPRAGGRCLAVTTIVFAACGAAWQPIRFARAQSPTLRGWSSVWFQADHDLIAGTATDDQIRRTQHPDPALVRDGMALLSQHSLAVFSRNSRRTPLGTTERVAGLPVSKNPLTIDAKRAWSIEGWAADSSKWGGEVRAVELYVDGRRLGTAALGLPRPDVAAYFGSELFRPTGWRIDISPDADGLPAKRTLRIRVQSHLGVSRNILNRTVTLR